MSPSNQKRTRAKICGITRKQDVQAVVTAGADAIGFVFFPPSPRNVTVEQAEELAKLIPPYVQMVGLFVNASATEAAGASAVLLDAWHPELKGGTGHQFDWSKFPKLDIPLILAGGLTPDNVIDAIHTTGAFAVDVSGGVESAKGIKDQQLIERFMQGVQRGSAK
ncbi:N-(5'-phosphoribosyl)anthranilate isomerase [Acinetobacter baumannii]|nr:N-(5'-phosphoribosyl)anthranilate isomerase [Acinetobacter baumannii]